MRLPKNTKGALRVLHGARLYMLRYANIQGKAQGRAARAFLHERVGQPIFHVARMAARGYLCSILCNPNALQPRTSRRQERTKHIPPSGAERQVVHMHHNGWAEVFGAEASGFKVPALFRVVCLCRSSTGCGWPASWFSKNGDYAISNKATFKIAQNGVFFS